MRKSLTRLALGAGLLLGAASVAHAASPYGTWVRPSTGTKVSFYDCGGKLCAKGTRQRHTPCRAEALENERREWGMYPSRPPIETGWPFSQCSRASPHEGDAKTPEPPGLKARGSTRMALPPCTA